MSNTTSTALIDPEKRAVALAREMRHAWHAGAPMPAEILFSRHPDLLEDPESAVELIYEEFCLRSAAGESRVDRDLLARFPKWAKQLVMMFEFHGQLLDTAQDAPRFPGVGEQLADFILTDEIARGAHGRVFVATQAGLADRPVVVKLTPLDEGGEHYSLARLQHTNIVPLYSVSEDADRRVRVLCMPYFGRATLAATLAATSHVPLDERTGQDIVAAMDAMNGVPPSGGSGTDSAARQLLANVSYVEAMCWIAACLADGLQFAHERGLVHFDLKPSNVLLAADGQPMLLDFHLACPPLKPGDVPSDHFGGTPPFTAPEQHEAMHLLRAGETVRAPVDGRADVYALGAMLYEALGGILASSAESQVAARAGDLNRCTWSFPALSKLNAQVSAGLSAIVMKCLSRAPGERYASAQLLADDLRRHLTHQPLAGVATRSLAERWVKWRRRQPGALRAAAAGVALAIAGIVLLSAWGSVTRERAAQASMALSEGDRQLAERRFADAISTYDRGLAAAKRMAFDRSALATQLGERLATARSRALANQVREVADDVRVLSVSDSMSEQPRERLRSLADRCVALWDGRHAVLAASPADSVEAVSADLHDVALFAAGVLGNEGGEGQRLSAEIDSMFGANEPARRQQLGDGSERNAGPLPESASARQQYARGRALLIAGDLAGAGQALARAVELDPSGRWPNYYFGVYAHRAHRYEDAVAALSVAIGAAPTAAPSFHHRALAYESLKRSADALRDYDAALRLDPAYAPGYLSRGLLHAREGRQSAAQSDLEAALKHGADPATVHYNLAVLAKAANDPATALSQVERVLARVPTHAKARDLKDSLRQAGTIK